MAKEDAVGNTGRSNHCFVLGILVVHGLLLAWSARLHTPVASEMAHLAAGISHLQLNRFDLLAVNPPLVRSVAAIPVVMLSPETDWRKYDPHPLSRSEHAVGRDFVSVNGTRAFQLLTLGRWACIPFCLAGGLACYGWGRSLYGRRSGLLALVLWCFSPYVLGHGSLMICDAHAAAMAVVASYAFRRWLAEPSWAAASVAGILLGIAELCKSTLLLLYPVWLLAWLASHFCHGGQARRAVGIELGMLLALVLTSVLVINVGYGFDGSLQRLDTYTFYSVILSGVQPAENAVAQGWNRFAGSWLGPLPVPLPACYLKGLDKQKSDFDGRQWSFLAGRWTQGGWWHYYLYALAIKVPVGTWILLLMAIAMSLWAPAWNGPLRDEVLLVGTASAVLVLVSSQTGFNHHSRYVLPALPFVFVWVSKTARAITGKRRWLACVVLTSSVWSVASSLWVYPHSFSYFNELIGGPARGHEYLAESNVAWGQDLFYLQRWLDRHPEARPIHVRELAYFDLNVLGIKAKEVPVGPGGSRAANLVARQLGPKPGWYALNVSRLHESSGSYAYFTRFEPVARIGYSICVYHITPDEANRVRRELGLPELPG